MGEGDRAGCRTGCCQCGFHGSPGVFGVGPLAASRPFRAAEPRMTSLAQNCRSEATCHFQENVPAPKVYKVLPLVAAESCSFSQIPVKCKMTPSGALHRGGYPAGGQAGNGLEGLSCKPLGNLSLQMPELQKSRGGISLEVQWKNPPCKAVDTGSIPGGDAKIPHAAGQLSPQDPNHCVLVLCSLRIV